MGKGAYVTIGIGKEVKTFIISRCYYLDELIEKLPIGTSVTVTTTDCIDCRENINEMLGIKEEEEV